MSEFEKRVLNLILKYLIKNDLIKIATNDEEKKMKFIVSV